MDSPTSRTSTRNLKLELSPRQKELLHDFLDRLERSTTDRMISIRVTAERFPEYFEDRNPSGVRAWEDEIRALSALGWIKIDLGRGSEAHRIDRLRLCRERSLEITEILARITLNAFRSQAFGMMEESRGRVSRAGFNEAFSSGWFRFLEAEKDRIGGSSPPAHRRADLLEDLKTLCFAVEKLLALEAARDSTPLTWRQFSVLHFSDSKRLDSLKARILGVLEFILGQDSTDSDRERDPAALLSHFGIRSKEEVFLLKGPVLGSASGLSLDGHAWTPFLTLPESIANLDQMRWDLSRIQAILTIENEEPFHSWCAQDLQPDWLCIYLGGFPSLGKLRFLQKLVAALPEHAGLFHWGDLDCGGIEILLFLEKKLGKAITPVGMEAARLEEFHAMTQPLKGSELVRLQGIRAKVPEGHALSLTIAAMQKTGLKLEQEALSELGSSLISCSE